ncbi:MAG: 23S rRNA (pseudouridine(1915)-N(3))-methyltransferase RlmH [Lachnospiraceae bacterium]|nr:23S rRNA (pseudouridine(1915)-N(3))-methyltransferase RlmH [Lachnospiraceae bacterium]
MRISILSVGKLKERFWRDACAEYEKRLSGYCDLHMAEVADERTPERMSDTERVRILETEGMRLLAAADPGAPLWVLDVRGKRMDSEAFSDCIKSAGIRGDSHIQFVIGGSCGVAASVTDRAQMRISFSDMTFPHQLMRVILLEQIYRGFRIMRGEPYHK